jgi:hypothetical protein
MVRHALLISFQEKNMQELTPDVWSHDTVLSLPLGLRLPLRMTVLRLPSGKLLLHNPVAIDDELAAALDRLGPVAELAAPNLYHHLFLGWAARRYPLAAVRGPKGLSPKKGNLSFASELGDEAPDAYEGAVETAQIHGAPKLNEIAFFHRPSRTLLVSDLVFNVRAPASWSTAAILTLMGTRGRLGQSHVWRFSVRDKKAAAAAVTRILAWDFSRVLMAHGEPLLENARSEMERVLARMRAG